VRVKRDRVIAFRGTIHEEERVTELAKKTGLTISEVLRQLLSSAELRPTSALRPVANLNSETSGMSLPASTGFSR
jgi:hypothetical protein